MSFYERFDSQFDLKYRKPSPERVDDFIDDTKSLLVMMMNSSRPVSHLQVLNYTKVAQRVLNWKAGDQKTLMNLLWHVVTEVSKSFTLSFPQISHPTGGSRSMPSFIVLLGELSLESYYQFMRAHPVESSFFARNGWPIIVGGLRNNQVLKHFSEFLNRGPIKESLFVVSKSLLYLTVADPAMRTIVVFLAAKCGCAYQRIWDEAKEDVLRIHKQIMSAGKDANEILGAHYYGAIPENREYSYFSCMPLRGWRPPGEGYSAFYNALCQSYSEFIRIERVDYSSTNYVTIEREFGYFLDRIILDFELNGTQLNKTCFETFKTMVDNHFKSNTKPLVHFIKSLHNLSHEVEIQHYYESRSLEQFKILLQFQALGEVLTKAILNESTGKNLSSKLNVTKISDRNKWFHLSSYKFPFKQKKNKRQ